MSIEDGMKAAGSGTAGKENAREIDEPCLNIEEAIATLRVYQTQGENVFVNYRGHKLYSVDITEEGAYLQCYGQTKAELEERRKKAVEKFEQEDEQKKKENVARIPGWIESGKNLVDSAELGKWEKMVKYVAEEGISQDIMQNVIELMDQLEKGATIDEVQKTFDKQDHSGGSYATVRAIVGQFSKRGEEFDQLIKL